MIEHLRAFVIGSGAEVREVEETWILSCMAADGVEDREAAPRGSRFLFDPVRGFLVVNVGSAWGLAAAGIFWSLAGREFGSEVREVFLGERGNLERFEKKSILAPGKEKSNKIKKS